MSSRLAFAPDRVKASLATSKMRSRLRCASVRGFRPADCEGCLAILKIFATGGSLRLSYLLIRRHSPFYSERVALSIEVPDKVLVFHIREVRNMTPLAPNKPSKNSNSGCADLATMAEHDLSASIREWRLITAKASTRLASRVNASSLSTESQTIRRKGICVFLSQAP